MGGWRHAVLQADGDSSPNTRISYFLFLSHGMNLLNILPQPHITCKHNALRWSIEAYVWHVCDNVLQVDHFIMWIPIIAKSYLFQSCFS